MYTDPVVGETFFGRATILSLLQNRVGSFKRGFRQNVAITGHRLAGKSSVLHQFIFQLDDPEIIALYMELVPEPFRDFAHRFIATLLYNFLRAQRVHAQEDIGYLLTACRQEIPRTVGDIEKILHLIDGGDFDAAYARLLNLTSVIRQETGKSCVVIFDEFHNLNGLDIKDPFNVFGKRIMVQKDTMYVVSSSQIDSLRHIIKERLALLFGNFQMLELSGFDHDEAFAFIRARLGNLQVRPAYVRFLSMLSDGYPFHLTSLLKRMKELAVIFDKKEADEQMLLDALQSVIFCSDGAINRYYLGTVGYLFEDPEYSPLAHVLFALANGNRTMKTISAWLHSTRDTGKFLDKLCELNIIYRNGSYYFFYDNLLGFWIKHVHELKKMSLSSVPLSKEEKFRQRCTAIVAAFSDTMERPVEQRIAQLLKGFTGEMIQIDQRTHKLPVMHTVDIHQDQTPLRALFARAAGGEWFFGICPTVCTEEQISHFARIARAAKTDAHRRVLILLRGIDPMARIIAKEKKFWLWESKELNQLFCVQGLLPVVPEYNRT